MAMADYCDFVIAASVTATFGIGARAMSDYHIGDGMMTMVGGIGWRWLIATRERRSGSTGGTAAPGATAGRRHRAHRSLPMRRRTLVTLRRGVDNLILVIASSADRAGAAVRSARIGRDVKCRLLVTALDAVIRNTKDGGGKPSIRGDPTRVTVLWWPLMRVGLR